MAVGAIMTVSAFGVYKMIHNNQVRTIAATELEQVAKNTRLLMGARGDYNGVSVEYLQKAGALKSDKSPLGGQWSVTAGDGGKTFSINLNELSAGECEYFLTARPTWADAIMINGRDAADAQDACFTSGANQVSFITK